APEALKCLRSNLLVTALAGHAAVVAGPAETSPIPVPSHGGAYDLIFLDPPFPLSSQFDRSSPLSRVFARLCGDIPVAPNALCIWRYEAGIKSPDVPVAGWQTITRRKYGRSMLSWLTRDATVA